MQTFVMLLRGINVGSTRKLPMADLRALCTKAGWKRPETYIQSGNLIVDADDAADKFRRSLAEEKSAVAFLEAAVAHYVRAPDDRESARSASWGARKASSYSVSDARVDTSRRP
jgi:hypothetical protein